MAVGLVGLLLQGRRRAVSRATAAGQDPTSAIAQAVSELVLHGRTAARNLARRSLATQFEVEHELKEGRRLLLDRERALQIGRAHAAAVRAELEAQSERKTAGGGAVIDASDLRTRSAWTDALEATDYRVGRIGVTETFEAANEERIAVAHGLQSDLGIPLFKEWNAEGDACRECELMDGERVPLEQPFSNGKIPGGAHPSCRCWTDIVTR